MGLVRVIRCLLIRRARCDHGSALIDSFFLCDDIEYVVL
jgi:hypothetical protein